MALVGRLVDDSVSLILIQIFLTLITSKILSKLLSKLHQPGVIGQIIAGIILGPSVFGWIPNYNDTIWPESSKNTFSTIANLGLIFFMFFLGLEIDGETIKNRWKTTIPIAMTSILIPFGVGAASSVWLQHINHLDNISYVAFLLFIGAGIGFSAFPVLAALLNALNLLTDEIGILTISLAAIEDIAVWIVLAVASSLAVSSQSKGTSSTDSALNGLYTVLIVIGFLCIMTLIIRPILDKIHKHYVKKNNEFNIYFIVSIFLLLILSSFATEILQIHAFFGAFVCGLIIPKHNEIADFLALRIELIIIEFFLPLYFVNSGLATEVYLLNTGSSWLTLLELIILSSAAKIIPLTLISKLLLSSQKWKFCLSTGLLMNTRGIVQLVVLNIAVQQGVLSKQLFAIFVLMATFMTFITSPLIHWLYKKPYKDENTDNEHNNVARELEALRRAISSPQVMLTIKPAILNNNNKLDTVQENDNTYNSNNDNNKTDNQNYHNNNNNNNIDNSTNQTTIHDSSLIHDITDQHSIYNYMNTTQNNNHDPMTSNTINSSSQNTVSIDIQNINCCCNDKYNNNCSIHTLDNEIISSECINNNNNININQHSRNRSLSHIIHTERLCCCIAAQELYKLRQQIHNQQNNTNINITTNNNNNNNNYDTITYDNINNTNQSIEHAITIEPI